MLGTGRDDADPGIANPEETTYAVSSASSGTEIARQLLGGVA